MINSTPASPKKSKSSAATTSSDLSSGEANARRATVCAASSQFSTPEISRQRALSHDSCAVAAEAVASRRSFPSPCCFSFFGGAVFGDQPRARFPRRRLPRATRASPTPPNRLKRSLGPRLRGPFASIRRLRLEPRGVRGVPRSGRDERDVRAVLVLPPFASSGETVARIGSGFRSSVSGFNSPFVILLRFFLLRPFARFFAARAPRARRLVRGTNQTRQCRSDPSRHAAPPFLSQSSGV